MKFEIINPLGKPVMSTEYEECIPNKEQINAMLKAGYKLKLNGKNLTKKELNEFVTNRGDFNK